MWSEVCDTGCSSQGRAGRAVSFYLGALQLMVVCCSLFSPQEIRVELCNTRRAAFHRRRSRAKRRNEGVRRSSGASSRRNETLRVEGRERNRRELGAVGWVAPPDRDSSKRAHQEEGEIETDVRAGNKFRRETGDETGGDGSSTPRLATARRREHTWQRGTGPVAAGFAPAVWVSLLLFISFMPPHHLHTSGCEV